MKTLITHLTLLSFFFGYCQNQKKDLFLFVEKDRNIGFVETKNDTLAFQQYEIWFDKFDQSTITLEVNEKGNLLKMIGIKPNSKVHKISFNFTSNKKENNKITVKRTEIENFLYSGEIVREITFENFIQTLKRFQYIYIIDIYDEREISNEIFIAKKVQINNTF